MKKLALTLIFGLVFVLPVVAKEKLSPEIAANICKLRVRQESMARKGWTDFDFYISDGSLSQFGTALEMFNFEKCMAEKGHPLNPPK